MSLKERAIEKLLLLCALMSVFTMFSILGMFAFEAVWFFSEVSIVEFFTETRWTPLFEEKYFGILPLIWGTIMVAAIALAVAVPMGLFGAVFLSEYAPDRLRRFLKPALEVLAGIPTVVYGYFALTFITPTLRGPFPDIVIFNALSAGLAMGLMIMPTVCSLSEDAMMAVPQSFREGAYALGARRHEVILKVVIPSALSGIASAILLALSRAIGETMIVAIAAGYTPRLTLNPLESIQTMTAYIAQVSLGETPYGTPEWRTIFSVGLMLFLITFVVNLAHRLVVRRGRRY